MAGQNHHYKILNHHITSLDLKLFCEDTSPTLKGINNETPQRVEIKCTRKLFLNTED